MSVKLTDKSLEAFVDELSSASPTPGGGSVAALSGALGAALVSMVCNLTVGRKKYAGVQEDVTELMEHSERLRTQLTGLIEADAQVFTQVSQAMKMPRNTDDEKVNRAAKMEDALKAATNVPMEVAEACVGVMNLCQPVAEKGNSNAVSDAGVAMLMAEAGLRSAALNVLINLGWIKDQEFVSVMQARLDRLLAETSGLRDEVYGFVESKLLRKHERGED
ncbi:MAG: cyclodeaminase/cyclohydrolase family protein [Anaerolineae bacterium]|nr:cyclodeaminase/cyclohydrolase family protein [Anaerolineae bacterium]